MGCAASQPEAADEATTTGSPDTSSAPGSRANPSVLNLAATLQDAEASSLLMAFAKADFSEENLEFWLVVAKFRDAWSTSEQSDRQKEAEAILDLYLRDGAQKQVCVGDWRVKRVVSDAGSGTFSGDMFAEAALIAERTIAEDIFPRFQDSQPGSELAQRRPELCKPPQTPRALAEVSG